MTRENIERAARIFDAARRDDRFVDGIPAVPGLDNHDTFHIEGPSGYRFAVTSSHAGDRVV